MKKDKPRIQNKRDTLPTTADSMLQHAEITAHVLFLNWQKQKMLRSTCVILWTLIRQDYSSTRSSSSLAAWSTATRSTPPPARSSSMRRSWMTERKGASPLQYSGLRLFTGYTGSCAEWWFGRRYCGRRGCCHPESGRFRPPE